MESLAVEQEAKKPPYGEKGLTHIRASIKESLDTSMLFAGPGKKAEKVIEKYEAKKTDPKETLLAVAEGLHGLSNLEDEGYLDLERVPDDAAEVRELVEDSTKRIEGIREGRDRVIAENPEAYNELMQDVLVNLENDIKSNDPEGRFEMLRELGTAEYIAKAIGVLEGIEAKYAKSMTMTIEMRRSGVTGGVSGTVNTEQEWAKTARQRIEALNRALEKLN
jgi:hypothetical protein